jgi:RHS repeat-associated protein
MGFGRARCAVHSLISGAIYGYVYDGNGDRIAKGTLSSFSCNLSSNGFAIQNAYVVGQAGEQLSEMGGTQNWLHMNVFAGGRLVATYGGGTTYFALSDWLGTKRAETVPNGTCLSTYASLAYGDELTPNGTCPDATEHHYTDKEHDGESGNDFFLARYYSSTAGRFVSPDPLGGHPENPQTLNKYAYVTNAPLTLTDPTGLDSALACGDGDAPCGERFLGFNPADGSVLQANVQLESADATADPILVGNNGVDTNNPGGQTYTASANGSGLFFSNDGGKTSAMGIFVPGTDSNTFKDAGWANGGALSGFKYTLTNPNWEANQTEAGKFSFTGTPQAAGAALEKAGFKSRWGTENGDEYRSPGSTFTGANSGHFIVNPKSAVPASGTMHFGEHNPYSLAGWAIHIPFEAFK